MASQVTVQNEHAADDEQKRKEKNNLATLIKKRCLQIQQHLADGNGRQCYTAISAAAFMKSMPTIEVMPSLLSYISRRLSSQSIINCVQSSRNLHHFT